MTTIAFIGGGNMAAALISGLINNDYQLIVADRDQQQLNTLGNRYAIETTTDNHHAVQHADVIVLAVKPQHINDVLADIASSVQQKCPLMISVAAGVTTESMSKHLSNHIAIVRCMPNTPALIQCGASGLYANGKTSDQQRQLAESILRTVGIVVWVDHEHQLDTITALSGSGPAYFFLFMEILSQWGKEHGLNQATAQLLATQTALGAARLALESEDSPATLRKKVTSPNGTTESAIEQLTTGSFETVIRRALDHAKQRSEELAGENN